MAKLPIKIKKELLEFRATQENLILHYKSVGNKEMSYLVCWSILEKSVKTIAAEYRCCLLKKSLREWLAYLENSTKQPSKKPNIVIDPISLPQKDEFISALNYFGFNGDNTWLVMDSGGKHRRHRNELAHTGKRFVNLSLYNLLFADIRNTVQQIFSHIESDL